MTLIRYLLCCLLLVLPVLSDAQTCAGPGETVIRLQPMSPLVPPGYHTYDGIIALADSLAQNFPGICMKVLYGTSLGGRQLAALKISDNVAVNEPEPEILFDAGTHGDEIGGPENLIRFARDLCLRYGTDTLVTDLVNTREIWLFLMVNPDGRVSMSRFNNAMVDINRDYGYMWDGAGGSTVPFSQPETRAVRECMNGHRFTAYLSYHSGFQQAAYPWAYQGGLPADIQNLYTLAMNYSTFSLYPFLEYGQSFNIMYPSNGMSVDYAYGTTGLACFTMELSTDKQPPDPAFYYNYNYPAMIEMIREAGWGIEGTVTDSVSGNPVPATLWIDNFFPVYNDPVAGDFHKYVIPGQHTLRVSANGYLSLLIPGLVVPAGGTVSVPVRLLPDTGWYAFRVCECSVPGDSAGDERYTPGALMAPDNIAYSIGKGGWVILDLGDTLVDADGNDLMVYEAGVPDEGFSCYASLSEDGPWTLAGSASGTAGFDLGTGNSARFIKILDDGDGPSGVPDEGYDLDAVAAHAGMYAETREPPGGMQLRIYPNPSQGMFTMIYSGRPAGYLTVSDMTGREILRIAIAQGTGHMDLTGQPDGLYFYSANSPGHYQNGILVKLTP
jgi:hypothetical protein